MTEEERIANQERTILSLRLQVAEERRINANLRLQNRTMQHAIDALRKKVAAHDPERLFQ